MPAMLTEYVDGVPLVDHHVHGAYRVGGDEARFQNSLNEGNPGPLANPREAYGSQIGFAVRRWCAELLDLEPHVDADAYWQRRCELGESEVTRRLTLAAGVSDWLIDTGFKSDQYLDPEGMAQASGSTAHEIVRLETIAESLIAGIDDPAEYADSFGKALTETAATAVGAKSVLAYRGGFDRDLSRPDARAVVRAARHWKQQIEDGAPARLTDLTLLSYGIHTAVDLSMPLQFHVGFGDRDLNLAAANPLHLMDFLRGLGPGASPILLLHNYPYEREAGYLAHAFDNVYIDAGLATPFLGVQSRGLIARTLELAPFAKILYSSDAFGPAELHYLGARLWRNGIAHTLGKWVQDGDWSEADAMNVVRGIAQDNARRAYRLPA